MVLFGDSCRMVKFLVENGSSLIVGHLFLPLHAVFDRLNGWLWLAMVHGRWVEPGQSRLHGSHRVSLAGVREGVRSSFCGPLHKQRGAGWADVHRLVVNSANFNWFTLLMIDLGLFFVGELIAWLVDVGWLQ